jgi:hypothetical protein
VFEAWTKSDAFRAAHHKAGDNKPLYLDHPQFEGFEVRQTVGRGKTLEGVIAASYRQKDSPYTPRCPQFGQIRADMSTVMESVISAVAGCSAQFPH